MYRFTGLAIAIMFTVSATANGAITLCADGQSGTSVARKNAPIATAAGEEYQEYDLGVHELTSTMYLTHGSPIV